MKTKGLRKSKNIQDARGRSVGSQDLPSNLSAARDRKTNDKFFDGKHGTASKGKMAHAAGAHGVDKAAGRDMLKNYSTKKPLKGKR